MGLIGAWSSKVSPDGKNVYVAAFNGNALSVFSRNPENGLLSHVESHVDVRDSVEGLAGTRYIAISPDSLDVYVTGETDGSIVLFNRAPATGDLSFVTSYRTLNNPEDDPRVGPVRISPDGNNLYP